MHEPHRAPKIINKQLLISTELLHARCTELLTDPHAPGTSPLRIVPWWVGARINCKGRQRTWLTTNTLRRALARLLGTMIAAHDRNFGLLVG